MLPPLFVTLIITLPSGVDVEAGPTVATPVDVQSINAVDGDASWDAAFGLAPTTRDGEDDRIATHLLYVERSLRAADTDSLPPAVRARRAAALDVLGAYRRARRFPRRTLDGYQGRRPRFIDDDGTHCAVGYLLAASGHAALARKIDAEFEYAYVEAIDQPELAAWATDNGFTRTELARIQPTYRRPATPDVVRRKLEKWGPLIAARCGGTIPQKLVVGVRGDDDGSAIIERVRPEGEFATCFVKEARRFAGHGPSMRGAPEPFSVDFEFEIDVDTALERILRPADLKKQAAVCIPKPGRTPRRVRYDVAVQERAVVFVRTTPRNKAVEACIEANLGRTLQSYAPFEQRISARVGHPLEPSLSKKRLGSAGATVSHGIREECGAAPHETSVTIRAHHRKQRFTAKAPGASAAWWRCAEPKLIHALSMFFTPWDLKMDRKVEPLIDADVTVSIIFGWSRKP